MFGPALSSSLLISLRLSYTILFSLILSCSLLFSIVKLLFKSLINEGNAPVPDDLPVILEQLDHIDRACYLRQCSVQRKNNKM